MPLEVPLITMLTWMAFRGEEVGRSTGWATGACTTDDESLLEVRKIRRLLIAFVLAIPCVGFCHRAWQRGHHPFVPAKHLPRCGKVD